ncbi:acyl-CoA thioesterase [Patiriisocius marinus]|uniref:Thioesterase n=1 Tax=Patiriisocius marinus TaxID=1397112 RepID=A0A5J4J0N2_9FLAO|nr:thioesterase family protein [Patiriisocius marinus]GER60846.1 thioesterase [Patiriisocius marinus]
MKKTPTQIRVRYAETDQMGVVYHGNYAQYLEQGRTEWLRNMGFSYKWMEDNGIHLPVIKLSINYKAPAKYDDELTVFTSLRKIPTYRIEFCYEIYNQNNELLVTADTTLVFINSDTNKLMKAPKYLLDKLVE